jgi:hypothetical protein
MSFTGRQQELDAEVGEAALRLKQSADAIATSARMPVRLAIWVRAVLSARWFRFFSGTHALRLDQRRSDLRQRLMQKHFNGLQNATPTQRKLADRRFRREYALRSTAIYLGWTWFAARWWVGATAQSVYQFLSRYPPLRWIDVQWRPTVFALSLVALVSISVLGSIVEIDWTPWARGDFAREAAKNHSAQLTDARIVYPTNDSPQFWAIGSSIDLLQGFNAAPVRDLTPDLPDACSLSMLIVFGTASAEGSAQRNSTLARARAVELAYRLRSNLLHCPTRPSIALVALHGPLDPVDDGSQRKAFAAGVPNLSDGVEIRQIVATLTVDRMIAERPSAYRHAEVCSDLVACVWVPLERRTTGEAPAVQGP